MDTPYLIYSSSLIELIDKTGYDMWTHKLCTCKCTYTTDTCSTPRRVRGCMCVCAWERERETIKFTARSIDWESWENYCFVGKLINIYKYCRLSCRVKMPDGIMQCKLNKKIQIKNENENMLYPLLMHDIGITTNTLSFLFSLFYSKIKCTIHWFMVPNSSKFLLVKYMYSA